MTLDRRSFIKVAGAAGVSLSNSTPQAAQPAGQAGSPRGASVRVTGDEIQVETGTLTALFRKGFLTSLKSRSSGTECIRPFDLSSRAALDLVFVHGEPTRIDESKFGSIAARQVSDTRAEFILQSWDGDGMIAISADPASGDLLVEPSGYSSRPGVRACRWNIRGITDDLQLVAPFFQGVRLPLSDSLVRNSHWPWPSSWEAAFAVLAGGTGGFWVRTEDTRYRYKALHVGSDPEPLSLGFDTEAYGPVDQNLSAGGLAWRINCFSGDWKIPAGTYRDWLWRAYGLDSRERERPSWMHNVALAVSWCPTQPDVLDALAGVLPAARVLLHLPNWRTDAYDENYPTYVASDAGRSFVEKAQKMGFRVMPHFNSIDMDPSHPAYQFLRDFQYRDIESKRVLGWSWYERRVIGVPESNNNRIGHRDKKVMVKVHPGLSMWRSILGENILKAAQQLNLETVFIDVTLTTYNLYNSLVEGMTSTEGMHKLIDQVTGLGRGLVVAGEGLNEITMQGQSFAQAHLFKSWQTNAQGLERAGGCPLNEFLFGRLCRTIGYSGLSGRDEAEELRMRIHEEHQAIPTITVRSAAEILQPNPAVKQLLERARQTSTK
ncbi:MAG: hypothetical protein EHM61_04370 [Acidobacteria bacterium]|nr:MAG: hypothetical protein EHM61_04370 [Acidobacteriota bacterium]